MSITTPGKDHNSMRQIQALMDGSEWDADTLDRIAEIMRWAGYPIANAPDADTAYQTLARDWPDLAIALRTAFAYIETDSTIEP